MDCAICLSRYENPVVIPCGHSFCRNCLSTSVGHNGFLCPTCRQAVPKQDQWIRNFAIEDGIRGLAKSDAELSRALELLQQKERNEKLRVNLQEGISAHSNKWLGVKHAAAFDRLQRDISDLIFQAALRTSEHDSRGDDAQLSVVEPSSSARRPGICDMPNTLNDEYKANGTDQRRGGSQRVTGSEFCQPVLSHSKLQPTVNRESNDLHVPRVVRDNESISGSADNIPASESTLPLVSRAYRPERLIAQIRAEYEEDINESREIPEDLYKEVRNILAEKDRLSIVIKGQAESIETLSSRCSELGFELVMYEQTLARTEKMYEDVVTQNKELRLRHEEEMSNLQKSIGSYLWALERKTTETDRVRLQPVHQHVPTKREAGTFDGALSEFGKRVLEARKSTKAGDPPVGAE